MAENENREETKKVVDISRFFTKKNEEEGTWVEPVIYGELVGLEFKVLGANSVKLSMVIDDFKRKSAEIESIKDPEERARRNQKLYAESASKRVVGMRPARNVSPVIDGEELKEYSDELIKRIFEESPDIAGYIIRYSVDSSNFMTKKND